MLAETLARTGIRILGDLPPNGTAFWAGRFWDRAEAESHPVLGEHYRREKRELHQLIEAYGAGVDRVIEFCCGSGEFIPVTRKLTGAREYVGVDVSEHALARAAALAGDDAVRLVRGDFWDDGLRLGTADLVLCVDSMQHLGNTGAVLARLRSFLAPGGVLIGNAWTLDHYHELERLRYGSWRHLGRSASFLGSAVMIRVSGGRWRSDNYRTKLVSTSDLEAWLRRTFDEVPQVTHHRYHTTFVCRA